jgi:glucokinase
MKSLIGVDIGGTNIKLALMDKRAHIMAKGMFSTAEFKGRDTLIDELVSRINSLIAECSLSRKEILGVGVGAPGPVDIRTGTVHSLTNIPNWREVRLGDILKKRLKLPVYVDNDVHVMALGEMRFGAARGAHNILCTTLGTGVGGGLIFDGRLYRGSNYAAGEFGHVPIGIDGPKCNCGGKACIEAYVGNRYIVRDVVARIKKGEKTLIKKLVNGDLSKITPETIDKAADRGDAFARRVWEDVGNKFGIALAGAVNLLNIEKVVIGGGIAKAGRILFDSIKKTVHERAMKLSGKAVKIVKAKLGYDAGVIGAASLVLYELRHCERSEAISKEPA